MRRTPTIGLYLPQLRMPWAVIDERVRVADEAGLDSVWFMDHLAAPALPDADTFEGWTVATAAAARTERIRIGHLTLCDALRPAPLLAKMAATLDHVSGGRFDLGIGWGSVPRELRQWGITDDRAEARSARLAETLEVLEALFTGEPVTSEGAYHRLDGAVARPVPVQDRIPLHLGGGGETLTLPLVRRFADWWNCPSYAFDRLAELRPQVGDVKVSLQRPLGLARSSAARDEVDSLVQRRYGGWGGVVSGTPDEVAERFRAEADDGVDLFIVMLHDFGEPETIRLLADEVLPSLA